MDNFHIDITSDENLAEILNIGHRHHKTVGYVDSKKKGLILFWHNDSTRNSDLLEYDETERLVIFPFKAKFSLVTEFVKNWLDAQDYDKWGKLADPCDHDGHNGKGFRVYNEAWGRVSPYTYSFLAIMPKWAWYGK